MSLWFTLGLMTAAAVFAVVWPLRRRGGDRRSGSDVVVYRDQLEELERDRQAGRIGQSEAEAAWVEIARRLIAAADSAAMEEATQPSFTQRRRRIVLFMALTLLPIGAGSFYLALGAPNLPGAPLAARLDAPPEQRSIDSLIAQAEAHLKDKPDDGRGWEVLAPIYMRLGRFEDAATARRNALRFNGASAPRESDYGEALVAAASGVVTAEAKAAFERAMQHDSEDFKARYFLGLAAEQDGRREQAAVIWRRLLAGAPAAAPWIELVERSLARVDPRAAIGRGPGPSAEDVASAANLPVEERTAMVRGMVERLAARLKEDGSDVEGWLRLLRAYSVLGETDSARQAASDARRALAADADKVRQVDEMVKALGLEG